MQFWLENLAFLAETKGLGRICPLPIPYYNLPGASGISPFSAGTGGTFTTFGMFGFQIIANLSADEKGTEIYANIPDPTLFDRPIVKFIIQKLTWSLPDGANVERVSAYANVQEVPFSEVWEPGMRVGPRSPVFQAYLPGEPSTSDGWPSISNTKLDIFRVLVVGTKDCVLCYSNEAYTTKTLYPKPFAQTPSAMVYVEPIKFRNCGVTDYDCIQRMFISPFWTPQISPREKLPVGLLSWPPKTPSIPNPIPSGTLPGASPPSPTIDPCSGLVDPTVRTRNFRYDRLHSYIILDVVNEGHGWDLLTFETSTNGTDWVVADTVTAVRFMAMLRNRGLGAPPFNSFAFKNDTKNSTFYTRVLASNANCTSPGRGGLGNGGSVTTNFTLTTPAPPLNPFVLTTVSYTGPAWALGRRGHFIWEDAGPSTLHYTFEVSTDGIRFSHMARLAPQTRLSIGICGLGGRCIAPMFRRGVTYYLRVKATSINRSILYSNTVTVTSGAPVFPFRGGGAAANQDTHWFFHNKNDDNSQERGFINHKHTFWLDDNVSPNLINLFYLKMTDGTEYKVQYTQKEGIVDSPREWIAPDDSGPCIEAQGFYIDNVYVYSGETRITPESDEDQSYINLGGIVNVSYYRSQGRPAPDYTTLIEYSTNDADLSDVDEIGGWFYHFSKKVAFEESEPYHAVGNGVDGIGLFLGTSRAAFETSYLEESPLYGFVPAYNEKMGYGTGSGIPGARFGEILNNGTKDDFCWDPLISRSAMVKISYNLSNLKNFRGKIDGSIYNIPTGGGEMQEIGGIKYENTEFGIGFENPSTIINNLYINVTGYIPSVDGYGCSICHNARLSGNSSTFSTIHDIDGFDFSVGLSGTLRFSGTYKKYSPIFACLSETDLGEVESVEYAEDIPYSIMDDGFGFFCAAGDPPCNVIDTEKSVIQQLDFTGMEYPVPDSFWRARVVNDGAFPVSISVHRITVSGDGAVIVDYLEMPGGEGYSRTLMEGGSFQMVQHNCLGDDAYTGSCGILCTGATGYWNGANNYTNLTAFGLPIFSDTTDFFIMLCRNMEGRAEIGFDTYYNKNGSDTIQENLQYIKTSNQHSLSQEIVDHFNENINYRSGINDIGCAGGQSISDYQIQFNRDYQLQDFEEKEFIVREECEKSYVDFDIDFEKITYNPIGIKVINDSNFPVLFSVGAGRFKTNYGVVDPSGALKYGNRGEIDFNSYIYSPNYVLGASPYYPTGTIGFIGPDVAGESREYLIDPSFDYIVLHVARYAQGYIYPYYNHQGQDTSTINEIYIFSKNGVSEEILNHYRGYDSVPDFQQGYYEIPTYGKMAKPVLAPKTNELVSTLPVRVYQKTGDFDKNRNISLTYSEDLEFITDLNGNFIPHSVGFPAPFANASGVVYDRVDQPDISIPNTSGSHFVFEYVGGIEKRTYFYRNNNEYSESFPPPVSTGIAISVGEPSSHPLMFVTTGSSYRNFYVTNNDMRTVATNYGVFDTGVYYPSYPYYHHMHNISPYNEESGISIDLTITPSNLSQKLTDMRNSWGIEHFNFSTIYYNTPMWKSSYFEMFMLSGESIQGYIKGGTRAAPAYYSYIAVDTPEVPVYPDAYTTIESIENLSITMYRVNHSVSIANYGAEVFTC